MSDDERALSEIIPRLGAAATRLNNASTAINNAIKQVEGILASANISDLHFWFNRPIDTELVPPNGTQTVWRLGYGRFIANHPAALVVRKIAGQITETTTLLMSSRRLRTAALAVLPEFLAEITKRLEEEAEHLEKLNKRHSSGTAGKK